MTYRIFACSRQYDLVLVVSPADVIDINASSDATYYRYANWLNAEFTVILPMGVQMYFSGHVDFTWTLSYPKQPFDNLADIKAWIVTQSSADEDD